MKRVCDYIADFISKELKADTIFTVTGGGAMFLNDAFAEREDIRVICNHHEQASAMAASGYARKKNDYGVAVVTTGCGGTNTITGLLGAWQDSIPLVIISGQVKRAATVRNSGLPLRQLGVQEADIINIVQSLCKYAVMVNNPEEIKYHLEKAAYLAKNGRPGPVWLDIPQDVQSALIDENKIAPFTHEKDAARRPSKEDISKIKDLIIGSKRPVIIAGNGVHLSNSNDLLKSFLEKYSIPAVFPFMGADLIASDSPLHVGRIGSKGSRAGNFAVQNADLVIAIGTRLSLSSIGFEKDLFAREAYKVVVDIDPIEHDKKLAKIDMFVEADASAFLKDLSKETINADFKDWTKLCNRWKNMWPVCLPEYAEDCGRGVNLYYTVDYITRNMPPACSVVSDAGSAFYVSCQGGFYKEGARHITTGAQAEMGYSLPAAIGVAAVNGRDVFAFTGDGSFQMNIQELQTLKETQLPVKLIVLNNDGYLSIRATQRKFFGGRKIGTDSESGLSFPSVEAIAKAYNLPYVKIEKVSDFPEGFNELISIKGPVVCEVISERDQEIIPALSTIKTPEGKLVSKPLEDMYPFLDRNVFNKEMIVKPAEE
ncbi:acetolactate synthase-1/2/3 large subunit [Parelusimicrobium proximum]|uniref:thiamine pyrophosphate-binding protein n=1 Tax=Parelusimicrobium proximum TaxID=3228953 RepID=UPI003D180973